MSFKDLNEIKEVQGNEGTIIKQIFHPHNTTHNTSFSLAHFSINVGKKSILHQLKSSEVYFILEGDGILYIDDKPIKVKPNSSVYVAPMSKQYIENTGSTKLRFLCIVEPAWKQEDEIILE
jgi:mannose-6-phosphate isomerase-like protein (cupin superfamily)